MSERANESSGARERRELLRPSDLSERANDQEDERMAHYSTRRYHIIPTKCRTDGPTYRPRNKTPICMIKFDQAEIRLSCKCFMASVVLGCNKKIITIEKVDFGYFGLICIFEFFPGKIEAIKVH